MPKKKEIVKPTDNSFVVRDPSNEFHSDLKKCAELIGKIEGTVPDMAPVARRAVKLLLRELRAESNVAPDVLKKLNEDIAYWRNLAMQYAPDSTLFSDR